MIHLEKKELQFSDSIERFFGLRKFLKENPTAKVLKKGRGHTHCRGRYVYAIVEVQAEPSVSLKKPPVSKEPTTKYFYSKKERADFIKKLRKEHRKIIGRFDYNKHCYDGHIWAVKFEA